MAYHVIGEGPASGLEIADGWLRTANDALGTVRMPLFTFLSGFVYSLRPFSGDAGAFVRGKARRLLLPMLTVGTAFAVVQALAPGSHGHVDRWWTLHLLPVAHFWFVEALFLIFLVVLVLERLNALSSPRTFVLCWAGAAVLNLPDVELPWLSVGGMFYLLPFFLLGLGCGRFGGLSFAAAGVDARRMLMPWFAILVLLAFLFLLWPRFEPPEGGVGTLQRFAAGTLACLILIRLPPRLSLLAWVGRHSYAIYLFHVFFTAPTRLLLKTVAVGAVPLHLAAGILAGVAIPILIERLLRRSPLASMLLLGKRYARAAAG